MSSPKDTAPDHAERLERLRAQSELPFPESWRHTEQEPAIAGVFVRLEHGPTRFGIKPIAIVRIESGEERSVWMLNEVLRNQFAHAAPQLGDLVVVRWEGKRTSGGGNEYDDYRVVVDPIAGGPNWARVAAGPEPAGGLLDRTELEAQARSLEHVPQADRARAAGGQGS